MIEKWLPIEGYEGMYSVSDQGRVMAHKRYRCVERILKGGAAGAGYRKVTLCKDGKRTDRYIHELVLATFVGPRPLKMDAAHGNGNRADNRLTNLRWATRAENHADKIAHGTHCSGERHGRRKLTEKEAAAIRASAASCTKLSEQYGVGRMQISRIRRGVNWRAA